MKPTIEELNLLHDGIYFHTKDIDGTPVIEVEKLASLLQKVGIDIIHLPNDSVPQVNN